MTDTKNLNRIIASVYENQLSAEELFEAESCLIGFFELLVSIDKRNKSQTEGINNEQSYER